MSNPEELALSNPEPVHTEATNKSTGSDPQDEAWDSLAAWCVLDAGFFPGKLFLVCARLPFCFSAQCSCFSDEAGKGLTF
jgi:hypothetical protein